MFRLCVFNKSSMFNRKVSKQSRKLFDAVVRLEDTFYSDKLMDPKMVGILDDLRDSSLRLLEQLKLVDSTDSDI